MKRRLLIITLVSGLLFSMVAAFIPSSTAYASTGNNTLLLVGEHCHDLVDLAHEFSNIQNYPQGGDNTHNECSANAGKGWQELLHDSLGCSDHMYYSHDFHTDLQDSSKVTATKWYTHEDAYKYCYTQASAQYNLLASPTCATMVKGSDNWNQCQDAQNKLYIALGCESNMFQDLKDGQGHWAIKPGALSNCQQQLAAVGDVHIVVMGAVDTFAPDPNPISSSSITPATPGGGGGGAGAGGAGSVGCNLGISASIGGILNALNPLNWLMCGVVKGMDALVIGLDQEINNYLSVGTDSTNTDNPNQIFSGSGGCSKQVKPGTCDDYQTAWSKFRDIALGLLVIVGLIIVISQALGMEILDAYTIRKMLPRVLIATIAITLSWQLMRFAVMLSNDLGYGIGNLISGSFGGIGRNLHTGGVNNLLGALAVGLGGLLLDLLGMLSFIGTAAIAVIITFLVLTLRQIVIVLLILVSPLAILAYVLPNTQRVYKFWWESFSKVLLMFPLIVAFITIGHVFSAIATTESDSFTSTAIAFIAYFGPYFAIPLTFRFAGSIMGGIGNAVNARGEGARRALAGVRSNRMKYNAGRLKAGTRFEGRIPGTRRIQDKLNETSKGIGTGFKGRFGIGKRGAIARAAVGMTAGQELLNSPAMKAIAGKNDYNRMMAEANGNEALGRERLAAHLRSGGDDGKESFSEEQIKERVDTAADAAKAQGGFTRPHALAAFYAMAQDGTAIRNSDDLGRLAAIVGNGDNNATLTAAATGAKLSRGANRPDLAVETGKIVPLAFAHSDQINKKPRGLYKDGESLEKLQFDAWKSGRGSEVGYTKLSSARSRAVRSDTRSALNVLQNHQQNLKDIKEGKIDQATGEPVGPIYEPEDVEFAAAALYDDRTNINQGYGRLNNKKAFAEEMVKDKTGALDAYLTTPTGKMKKVMKKRQLLDAAGRQVVEEYEAAEPETHEDAVKKLVGDRYANLNDEQRKAAQQRDAEEQK